MSKPEKRFKCGPVSASIWAKAKTVEGEMVKFYSVSIDKAYKDGDEWKHTKSFATEDLPKVALVANEAYKYLRFRSMDEES
ncbi:MAG TPA: hypothetical protein VMW72_05935 [Sedimentisphaerales bacterium]|nr:hypothetical protein [Sedimentisphaerales bacterium]